MDSLNCRLSPRLQLSAELAEQLYSKIADIDAVKNTFRLTHTLLPQTIERLTQFVIVTSTGASNRIEGNRLNDDEVESLYKSLRIKSFKTRDEQEVAGYLESLQLVFEHYQDISISESAILQLHKSTLTYRLRSVRPAHDHAGYAKQANDRPYSSFHRFTTPVSHPGTRPQPARIAFSRAREKAARRAG